jgi:DNA mismatch repair protein MutS2
MEVILRSTRRRGVLQRPGKRGQWVVATDSIKLTVSEDEIEPVPRRSTTGEPTVHIERSGAGPMATHELDVRGKSLAEAVDLVDSQIDRAVMTGLQRFGIIHGKGTGVLQRGVRQHLESSPMVSEISYATPEEGGYGKTIVELVRE